jgi:hypothetical protein
VTPTRALLTAQGYRVPQLHLPCTVGQAPHHWTPWKTIVTGSGRITQRTCTVCGQLQTGDEDEEALCGGSGT